MQDTYATRLTTPTGDITDAIYRNTYGGRPDTYPTRSLEGWKARQAAWQSYVFRAPDENVVHPFKQKY